MIVGIALSLWSKVAGTAAAPFTGKADFSIATNSMYAPLLFGGLG